MGAYGVCLATILVAAIFFYGRGPGPKPDTQWLSVFKDGFAFLGGLLATIVGYYFGNRNVGDALEKAKEEEAKAGAAIATGNALKEQLTNATPKNDPADPSSAPTSSEEGLTLPTPGQ
jgi:hypothetical protein